MLATLTDNLCSGRVENTERLVLRTGPPDLTTTFQPTCPAKMSNKPNHSLILHERYKRTSISKPLYAELEDNQFRLLRIVPGTRRGEFTAQIFETDLTVASAEYEYSILTLALDSGRHEAGDNRRRSSGVSEDGLDLTCFPILSLGGGEHQIEIPSRMKRALETVVERRWDCFHSRDYNDETRRKLQSRPNDEPKGTDTDGPQADGEKNLGDEDAQAGLDGGDEDGESDTGEGEDFYLWIRDICVDRTDVSDEKHHKRFFRRTGEGAKEIIVANVPNGMSGKIEIERLENRGSAKSVGDACNIEDECGRR